ncbi:MAG: ABC transporter ATP-binding protein [Pseudomonadota bacterium]
MDRLEAVNVTRSYGEDTVVDAVSLALEPGAVTALLGGSGAGKSTLLRLLAGLEPVDAGEVRLGGQVLSSRRKTVPAEKRRVGLVFQDFALFPHLTAAENVAFGLAHLEKGAARQEADAWLGRLGLSARAGAYPHQLSGGEQQRVSIARALAPKPAAILMDEPFSGLDPALREAVRDSALAVVRAAGIPALLVTHDAHEAMISADRLAVMRAGRVVQAGLPEEVYSSPVDIETAAALGPVNVFHARTDATGQAATPFGTISAPAYPGGTAVEIAVREEAVLLKQDGIPARVEAVARAGPLVRVTLMSGDFRGFALVSPTDRPDIGVEVGVSIDPAGAFIFGAGTS